MFETLKAIRTFAAVHREFQDSQGVPSSERTSAIRAVMDAYQQGNYASITDAINSLFNPVDARLALDYFNGWAYSCTMARKDGIEEIPIHVRLKQPDGEKIDAPEDYWFRSIMDAPNPVPHITFGDIIGGIDLWHSLAGMAYIYAPIDTTTGKPSMFYTVPPTALNKRQGTYRINGETLTGTYYTITGNGVESKPIAANEIITIPLASVDRDFVRNMTAGKGRFEASMHTLKVNRYVHRYLAKYFEENGMPPVLFELDAGGEEMHDQDWQKFIKTWLEHHQGMDARLPVGVGPRGGKAVLLDTFKNQKQLAEISEKILTEVLAVFKVPKGIMTGEYDSAAPAASFNALWYTFKRGTLAPPLTKICAVLTRWARQFDPNIIIEPEPVEWLDPEEVRRDELHRLKTARATINDIRRENKEEELPEEAGGDLLFIGESLELLESKVPVGGATNELRATVGGATALQALVIAYTAGQVERTSAINLAIEIYGFTPEAAAGLFPEVEATTPGGTPSLPEATPATDPASDPAQTDPPEQSTTEGATEGGLSPTAVDSQGLVRLLTEGTLHKNGQTKVTT